MEFACSKLSKNSFASSNNATVRLWVVAAAPHGSCGVQMRCSKLGKHDFQVGRGRCSVCFKTIVLQFEATDPQLIVRQMQPILVDNIDFLIYFRCSLE